MNLTITNIEANCFGTSSNVYDIYNKRKDPQIFENLIDTLILEKYADESLRYHVEELDKSEKRLATALSIGDDNYLWNKIADRILEGRKGYDLLKDVYFLLKDYVKIADVERKKHGEILTPFKELAEPMVKLVEKYDSGFWKNKNHKVLDSSAGYGTFLILAAYKFMIGLKDEFPDENERFKWVVENCLYYGELQAKSVFSWLLSVDPHDEYDTNIYWGSFLTVDFDRHMHEVWNVDKFDLIIQNPPYQTQKDTDKNKDSKNPKTQPLWHLFVQKSLSILKYDGYMIMVHPGGWRNPDGIFKDTQNLIKSKNVMYLKIHSFKDGLDIFGAKINFDYYILKNSKNCGDLTNIICEDKKEENIDISKVNFIPGENISKIYSLLTTDDNEKVNILHSYSAYEPRKVFMSKKASIDHIYPCVYMVSYKNIPTFLWSNRNDRGHFGRSKVIWASGSSGIIVDEDGEYALTPFSCAIIDSVENLENIKKALESEKFIKNIMLFKNGLGHKYNNKLISMLRKDFWKEFI